MVVQLLVVHRDVFRLPDAVLRQGDPLKVSQWTAELMVSWLVARWKVGPWTVALMAFRWRVASMVVWTVCQWTVCSSVVGPSRDAMKDVSDSSKVIGHRTVERGCHLPRDCHLRHRDHRHRLRDHDYTSRRTSIIQLRPRKGDKSLIWLFVTFSYSYEILFGRASFEPTRQQLLHSCFSASKQLVRGTTRTLTSYLR